MGAAAIAIWMLVVLPVLIIGAGLGGSLALDYVFARANRPAVAEDGSDEEGSGE